jgi:hypothetical protein
MSELILGFVMEEQTENNWCWAATTKAVSDFYTPGSPISQCDVAGRVKLTDCCRNPSGSPCNEYAFLSDALQKTMNFEDFKTGVITWSKIRDEISAGKIVCAYIRWDNSTAGHYVAVYGVGGIGERTKWVYVRDPDGEDKPMTYARFKTYEGQGRWLNTYFTNKPPERR